MTTQTTFTARNPGDLMAVVPAVLGFHPEESVVMLTFGGAQGSFHARVDLPDDLDDLPAVCGTLLAPALFHRVRKVVFIVYSSDAELATAVALGVSDAFQEEGFDVMEPLRSDGANWFFVCDCGDLDHVGPHPYDVSTHELTAQAVLDGRVTHASRADLAATLRPDTAATDRVAAALTGVAASSPLTRLRDQRRMTKLVRRHVGRRTTPSDAEVAWLAHACTDVLVRDEAMFLLDRENAARHVDFWTSVLRRTPEEWAAPAAAMAAFCAWLAGDGALAWCAVDRCRDFDPHYSLAECVEELLVRAVSPRTWVNSAQA
jgi:hypothetical protein